MKLLQFQQKIRSSSLKIKLNERRIDRVLEPAVVPAAGHGGARSDQRLQMCGRAASGLPADAVPRACGMALGGASGTALNRWDGGQGGEPSPKPSACGAAGACAGRVDIDRSDRKPACDPGSSSTAVFHAHCAPAELAGAYGGCVESTPTDWPRARPGTLAALAAGSSRR